MLQQVELDLDMKEPFFAMVHDFRLAGETRYSEVLEDDFDFVSYIVTLRNESSGKNLCKGHVPMTTL